MRVTTYQEILSENQHDLPIDLPMTVPVTAVQDGTPQLTLHAPPETRAGRWCGKLLLQLDETTPSAEVTDRCTVAEAVRGGRADLEVCTTCVSDYDTMGELAAMLDNLRVAHTRASNINNLLGDTSSDFPALRARNVVTLRRELGWTPHGVGFLQRHARPADVVDPALRGWWEAKLSTWRATTEELRLACRAHSGGWEGDRCYLVPHHRLWSPPADALAGWLAGAEVVAAHAEARLPDLPVFEVPTTALANADVSHWACLGPAGTGAPPAERLHAYLALRANDQHTDQVVVDAMVSALA